MIVDIKMNKLFYIFHDMEKMTVLSFTCFLLLARPGSNLYPTEKLCLLLRGIERE